MVLHQKIRGRNRYLTVIFSDTLPAVDDEANIGSIAIRNYPADMTDEDENKLIHDMLLLFLDAQRKIISNKLIEVAPASKALN